MRQRDVNAFNNLRGAKDKSPIRLTKYWTNKHFY